MPTLQQPINDHTICHLQWPAITATNHLYHQNIPSMLMLQHTILEAVITLYDMAVLLRKETAILIYIYHPYINCYWILCIWLG